MTVMPLSDGDAGPSDVEADVVVVGAGCAGMAAAYEAAAAGAEVVVLERASGPGGTSALSGGELYLGGGTALQAACGIEDDAGSMHAFLRVALGPGCDEDKLRAYCEGSPAHYEWLVARGVPFRASLWDAPTWVPPTDDGLMWLGERAWPFPDAATPAPRGHRPATKDFGGWLLMERLAAAALETGARLRADTVARRLLVAGRQVTGLLARSFGEDLVVRARRGVVLATGGFVDDEAMLAEHAPRLVGMDKVSGGGEDGSGIRMAQAAGGAVRGMAAGQVGLHVVPGMIARGMLVNRAAQRFINEDCYPGRVGQAALFGQGMGTWVVLDEQAYEEVPLPERWGVVPHHVAGTLEELAALAGLPADGLAATVAVYNAGAVRGEDALFHKDPRWLRPLTPPYAAVDPRRSFGPPGPGAAVFTLGGLATDADARVLDLDGRAVPGLWAAGRATQGLAAWGYVSGTSLGDGTFFGRRAGGGAARAVPLSGTSGLRPAAPVPTVGP